MLDEDNFFTARQTYRILSMIYLRSSFSYNSRDISTRRFGRKPFFFPLLLLLLLFTPRWRGYGIGDLFPRSGFLRLRSSRGCSTSQIWRIPVEPLALVHACHRHCVGTRGCACGDEGQTGAPTGEFLPVRISVLVSLVLQVVKSLRE